jgi:hypothetical protein
MSHELRFTYKVLHSYSLPSNIKQTDNEVTSAYNKNVELKGRPS